MAGVHRSKEKHVGLGLHDWRTQTTPNRVSSNRCRMCEACLGEVLVAPPPPSTCHAALHLQGKAEA